MTKKILNEYVTVCHHLDLTCIGQSDAIICPYLLLANQ